MGAGGTAERSGLVVGLLGPVEVRGADGMLTGIAQPRLRVLVAMLAIAPGRVASDESLVDALWAEEWSRERERNLHTHVSALRRLLAAAEPGRDASRLVRSGGGYRLDMPATEVDAGLFRSLAARGRAATRGGDIAAAAAAFGDALALWRGPAMADATGLCARLAGDAATLEDLRAAVLEDRIDCDLALGGHAEVAAEGPGLVAEFPLRERLAGQVMVALWRAGRRGEALSLFDSARRTLAQELGIDPGPELSGLHAKVLADDPSLAAPAAAGATQEGAQERTGARARSGPVPRQLPAGVGHFTGREAELKALDELLDGAAGPGGAVVVTALRGMAGVGKTALAVHWARTVADRFPDGQLYVNLRGFDSEGAPVTPGEVTGWFLAALGTPGPAIPADPQARAGLYRSVLDDRKVLLLLDNARDAAQVRPLLAGGPGCLALVTSRSSMASLAATEGARLIGLDQLDAEDATAMLTARLGRERVAGEPGAVATLVQRCSGLPLALAITAARAAESPGTPLAALVAELDRESGRLDALDLSGDDSTSVRAVFSWSLLHVSEEADRMFAFLGAHRGPDISLPAAVSLTALPAATAGSALDELASASLITEHRPGRYVLHDLSRDYAAEYAAATYSGDEIREAIGRIFDHYLHTLTGHPIFGGLAPFRGGMATPLPGVRPERPDGMPQMFAWLESEHAVLRQAIEQAAAEGLATAAWQLYYLFAHSAAWQGLWAEYEAAGQAAHAAAARAGDHAGLGWICSMLATFHAEFGSEEQVLIERSAALGHFGRAADPVAKAYGHQYLSDALCRGNVRYGAMLRDDPRDPDVRQRATDGLAHAEQAVVLHGETGNRSGEMWAHLYRAYHHARLGDAELARGACEQAAALALELGDPKGQSFAHFMTGFACQASGDLDGAIAAFSAALSLVPDAGPSTQGVRAECQAELGETYLAAGDRQSARRAFEQALENYEALHHPAAELMRARLDD